MILFRFQGKPFNITVIEVYVPTSNAEEAEVERFYEDLQDLLEHSPKKDILFIIWDWNAKVGSQETPEVTGKFGLGIRNERTGRSKHPLPRTQEDSTHGHHQMVNTKIRLITFFTAEDGKALYSQQKQDWELTVAQIINSYCQIQTQMEESGENH